MSAATRHILALDQGTGGSAAFVLDDRGRVISSADREIRQVFPQPGWVEQDAEGLASSILWVAEQALQAAGLSWSELAGVGITNQRETTVVWERETGRPIGPAIVWQCRRTAALCSELQRGGWGEQVHQKTGLPIDPYFSATKIRWLLDHAADGQARAEAGDLLAGTVDSWLLWRLSGGGVHATDFTNASRTMLFNIHSKKWDRELLEMLRVPFVLLPEVRASSGSFGQTTMGPEILGVAGDQQAALFGQACFHPGQAKTTYGTGAFLVMNTGSQPISSLNGLLTTLAIDAAGEPCYALEGAVFTAGGAVQWLRDGLQLVAAAADTESLARSVPDNGGVFFVPAFTGIGSPHWDPHARGMLIGLTAGARREHIVRATLEAIAFQTLDLFDAMRSESQAPTRTLRVDGGGSANDFTMQFQADIAQIAVERPKVAETTALGAAYLAGLAAGVWSDSAQIEQLWRLDRRFEPAMPDERRTLLIRDWHRAVERAKGWQLQP